ncbi:hypothetical protein [uncultured Roseobacter sp.]|uniref:anti-sigma factor family protein n=1 Tax=uncultured Roseobacter sp. TaxID=114847 RepID=UPI00261DA979|nr:hypothetical protein [uncultured Roseobacter sp.]
MQKFEFTDEELMAYADGELGTERALQLDAALVSNAALNLRLETFAETRELSQKSFEKALHEPVPEHLVQKVRNLAAEYQTHAPPEDRKIIAFGQKSVSAPFWKLPLAAALALAVGLGAGLLVSTDSTQSARGIVLATLTEVELNDLLDTVPSGELEQLADSTQITPIATFYDGSQTLCREFELRSTDGPTVVSVACEQNGTWNLRLAVATAKMDENGYVPASSLQALDAYLDGLNAGPPLDPAAEAAALQNLR